MQTRRLLLLHLPLLLLKQGGSLLRILLMPSLLLPLFQPGTVVSMSSQEHYIL
jgi:hypothetical protein